MDDRDLPSVIEVTPATVPAGNVIDLGADLAAAKAYEARIADTDDYGDLVGVAQSMSSARLSPATTHRLLRLIAAKASTTTDLLADLVGARGRSAPSGGAGEVDMPYRVDDGRLWLVDDDGRRQLANFVAAIAEEIVNDDGATQDVTFRLAGRLADGTPLPPAEVRAAEYPSMAWVPVAWGARAVVHAGPSTRDHVRAAIQMLSRDVRRRTVYGHTGWREISGAWVYLHGGGAITADGHRDDLEVDVGSGHMSRYRFAADAGDLRADIRASLRLLAVAPDYPALGAVMLAAVYRAPLGAAAPCDHGAFIAGPTGSRKSEVAGVALAHFGRGFDARHFPANFADTENDLEAKSFAAKDALYAVDDFLPAGSATDVARIHAKADRLFRGAGNQSGRGRRTADLRQRPAYYPRGLVVATGEDIPRGHSLRARMAILEVGRLTIDNAVLGDLQGAARSGELERAMAGYIRWLAGDMADWVTAAPGYLRALRERAIADGVGACHPRAADIYASLALGLDLARQYAVDAGALADDEAAEMFAAAETAIRVAVAAQGDLQSEQDEVTQFIGLLRSALTAGACHLCDVTTQGAPTERPNFWGWRVVPGADGGPDIDRALGGRIGWVDAVRVYLDGPAAYAAVQGMARSMGGHVATTEATIWRRLHDRGLLAETTKEAGKLRLAPQRRIGGVKRRVYVLGRALIEGDVA
ncbi:cell wall-binding protein [Methylocaldum gracile]